MRHSLKSSPSSSVFGDEINLVEPGFNSGYNKIDGIWLRGYKDMQRTSESNQ